MKHFFAKLSEKGILSSACAKEDDTQMIEQLLSEGFLPHEKAILPDEELGELKSYELKHRSEDEKIVSYYDVVSNDPALIQQKINTLKNQLQDMDYLDHKEADGEDMTQYGDWRAQRRGLRIKVRELEALIEI